MIRADHANPLVIVKPAAKLADGGSDAEQVLRGHRAETADELRAKDRQLAVEVFAAVLSLGGQRRAVARRTALDGIEDVDLVAREPHGEDHLREFLAGGADERQALTVFVRTRRLAHEDQAGRRISGAKDGAVSGAGQFGATHALGDFGSDGSQCGGPVRGRRLGGSGGGHHRLLGQ